MRKIAIFSFIIILGFISHAQQSFFGGTENDIPTSLLYGHDGYLYLTGFTKSSDEESDQLYVIKSTLNGEAIWEKTFGDIYGDHVFDFILTSENHLVLTGETWLSFNQIWGRENQFILELDEMGEILNQKSYFLHHRDFGLKIKEVTSGGYILNGFTKSADDVYGEMMVTRIDESLEIQWQTYIGEESSVDYGFEIIPNDQGFLAIGSQGGFFNSNQVDFVTPQSDVLVAQLNFNGDILWKKTYGGSGHDWVEKAVVVEDDIYLVGSTQSIGNGSFDMLLMKLNMNGDSVFSMAYGTEFYEHGRAISSGNGILYLGGITKKENSKYASSNYIIATDLEGELLWERVIESTYSDKLKDLEFDSDSSVLFCLSSTSSDENRSDFWLYTLNEDGQFTSIRELTRKDLLVYPNPVSDIGYIELPNDSAFDAELFLYDVSGKVVKYEKSIIINQTYPFKVTNLRNGFYTFRIVMDGHQYSGKFIIH